MSSTVRGGLVIVALVALLPGFGLAGCSGPPAEDEPRTADSPEPSGSPDVADAERMTEPVPIDFEPGAVREIAIGPSGCHVATLEIDRDRFVGVEVDQRGVDLLTTLREPGGRTTRFDTLTGVHGPEWASFVSERDGAHRIEICFESNAAGEGLYRLRIEVPRPPSPTDRALARGLRRYAEADRDALGGEPGAAVEGFEAALRDFESAGAARPRAWIRLWLGKLAREGGDWGRAEGHYAEATELFEALEDPGQAAVALSQVGSMRSHQTDLEGARSAYERSLHLAERSGDAELLALALYNLGSVQEKLGRTFEVVALQQRRRDLAVRIGDVATEWDALTRIGKVYRAGGDDARAFDLFQEALGLAREHGLEVGITATLIDLARVQLDREEPAAARDLLLKALERLGRAPGPGRQSVEILNNLGRAYALLDEVERARDHYRRALAAIPADDPEAGVFEALALINLASLDGNPPEAEASCRRALDLLVGAGRAWHATGALRCLAEVAASRGDLDLAASHLERAVGIVERLRGLSAIEELRASFLEDAYAYYERYVEVLRRSHELDPDGGHAVRAFEVAERARARLLLDELAGAEAAIRATADPELRARIEAIERRMSVLETELFVTSGGASEPDRSLQRRLRDLESEHALIEAEIFAAYPGWPTLLSGEPESVDEIRRSLLADGSTQLVSFFLGEERSFAWILGPSSLVMETLPGRDGIEDLARRAVSDLRRSDEPHLARRARWSAEALSREVLAPILPHLTARRLVLAKDGALHYVPFAVLPLRAGRAGSTAEATLLIDRFELVEAPSASAAVALRSRRATSRVADLEVAVFADPVFLEDDDRVSGLPGHGGRAASRGDAAGGELSRVTRSLGPGGLRRLTGSRLEAETIAELVPRDRRLVALGFDANRELLLGGTLGRYRVLHLAGHGLAHPGFTGLVLSLYDEGGRRVDGLIRSYELYGTELAAELVVLSACSTGLGDEFRGEGLLGLSRGFLYAGASQVLASLWDVDDRATAELMARFYRALLRDGDSPSRALRRAQRALRRDPEWSAPHHWAGFVLQGTVSEAASPSPDAGVSGDLERRSKAAG